MPKRNLRLGIILLVLGIILISALYAFLRGKGTLPGYTIPAQSPEEVKEIAGVKVINGGPANPDGSVQLASFEVTDGMIGHMPATLFSPDGRWVAFQAGRSGRGEAIWAMSLDGSAGKIVAETSEKEQTEGTLVLRLLGWNRNGRVVFARQGTQPDGLHMGEHGISVQAALPGEELREAAWLPLQPGESVNQDDFFPEKDSLFIHATDSLWRVNIADGQKTLLKKGLPSYDGLFYPRLSPAGDYYVYELGEEDRNGIFSLNAATGKEIALARNSDNFHFYPRWSSDGRHLAYYVAPQKSSRESESIYERYDVIPDEDGPLPVASGVDIVTPDGRKVAHLSLPGNKIANFQWSADGRHLAFAAGQASRSGEGDTPAIAWQSIWLADLNGNMRKVAELAGQAGAGINVINISPGGRQAHYIISGRDSNKLYFVEEGKQPAEVDSGDGYWIYGGPPPSYGGDFFLSRNVDNGDEIFRIHGNGLTLVTAGDGQKYILGVMGNRLVYIQEKAGTGAGKLIVLELTAA